MMVQPADNLSPEDLVVAAALEARRPAPAPAFRGALAQRLTHLDPGYGHRPARLWAHVAALTCLGALILALALFVSSGAL